MKWPHLFPALLAAALLACLFCGQSALAQAQPLPREADPSQRVLPVDSAITISTLPNGLRYYIRQNRRPEKRAELRLVVNAGSVLEDDDQQGLAHFVEHMAFNGTAHFARQELVDYLESVGMRFGPDLNAYTSFDETVYMLQIPTDSVQVLKTAFQILEDWAHLISFQPEEVDKERGVVIEEWRSGRGADARIRDRQFPVLFYNSRYAERLPIGQKAVLDTFHYQSLKRFYSDWYRPDLMAVIAVGDFQPAQIEQLIRDHFEGIAAAAHPRLRPFYPVPDHAPTLTAITSDPEATNNSISVYFKQDIEEQSTEADYRRMLVEFLYNGMFNRRLDEVRQQPNPPFLFAYSGNGRLIRTKAFYVVGAGAQENRLPEALQALTAEVERVKRYGFTRPELDRQKADMMRSIELAYNERDKSESRQFAEEYIRNFLTGEPLPGIRFEFELYRKYLPGITLEEVNSLAQEWIRPDNRVILADGPEKPGVILPSASEVLAVLDSAASQPLTPYQEEVSDAPLVRELPPPGKIVAEKKFEAIAVTEWTLSNGMRLVLKPTDFKNDEILFSAMSPGGNSLVNDADYVSAVTAAAIVQSGGAGDFPRIELEKKLAGKAVRVSPWIGTLQEGFSGEASPRDLETLFQLLHLYFTAPRKDSTAFLSYQNRLRGFLENRAADPENAFDDTVEVTMSQHHFRSRPWSLPMLEEMNLDRSYRIFRDRFANPGDFTFFFVGNIDVAELQELAENYLASLPATGAPEVWRDPGIEPPAGVLEKQVRKGLEPKSRVQVVFTGPFEWTRQNRYDINALEAVLRIRLRKSLREEKGGTYGVGVSASPSRYPRSEYELTISFGCAPERVEELSGLLFAQIDSLRQFGPSMQDIQKVQETQRREYETNMKKNGYWLGALRTYYFYDEEPTNILDFPQFVEGLTAQAVQQAAQKYLNLSRYARFILYPQAAGSGE